MTPDLHSRLLKIAAEACDRVEAACGNDSDFTYADGLALLRDYFDNEWRTVWERLEAEEAP